MRQHALHIDGDCDSRFNLVKQVFSENFANRLESEGAAFVVYLDGEKIVDLWGGFADQSSNRKWKDDTMSLLFSCTKSICGICFAVLVDRGLAEYSDLVSKHWPEFAKNGKEKITIEQLFAHQAGLAYIDSTLGEAEIKDPSRLSKIFEDQSPNWEPGSSIGYHMITIGFLFDQLIQRIDPQKRSLSIFFREEIAIPNGLEIYIGSPSEIEHRIARLSRSSKFVMAREVVEYPIILSLAWNIFTASHSYGPFNLFNSNRTQNQQILAKISKNIAWLGNNVLVFNNPDIRCLDIPSATGIGTARSLAKLHSLVVSGQLLKPSTVEKLLEPVVADEIDLVLTFRQSRGKGFLYTKNPKDQWIFGHPGIGGQNVKVDVHNKVAFAYLCNGMKYGLSDYTLTFMRLQKALYDCLITNDLMKSITPKDELNKERRDEN